jgi:hypothetical protein
MEDLGKLKGLGGLSVLGDVEKDAKAKEKMEKDMEKDKKGAKP